MPIFADQMKALVDQILASGKERTEAVASVKEHTGRVLADSRAFLHRLGHEHKAMARELHSFLSGSHRTLTKDVHSMRHRFQRDLKHMHDELRETLTHTRQQVQQDVGCMMHSFRQARGELAHDLHQAARIWSSGRS